MPWVADSILGLVVTATLVGTISARQGGTQQPDAIAYAWAAGLGALMLARRRYPRAVLGVTALGLFAYYSVGYPAVGVAVPLAAALFSAAEAGRLVTAAVTSLGVLGVSLMFRLMEGQDAAFVLGYDLAPHVTLMAVAIALGDGLRSRRVQQRSQRELRDLMARQYIQEAESWLREERLSIARDLHDAIGHALSVISLHAEVAREAIPVDDEVAGPAVRQVKAAASEAMRELRTTVGVLRSKPPGRSVTVSLAYLSPVLDTARAAGFDVEEQVEVAPGTLPRIIDAAAYRIVQEAVTNVVRHADASRLSVRVVAGTTRLRVFVTDDGPPPGKPLRAGHGIAGMTERARALGGSLRTRHEASGFTVEAELPLREPS
ncbi:two-component sensor histidine kinase [Winogradskya humida]|uniref:histidine kinase n=2 Tax=Winogradskya humida TaxID=113566 RepID=A0ABQ3ZYN4_9ACTN|nr:two-component sensor histidine kinase [Actinoplanes humidus]